MSLIDEYVPKNDEVVHSLVSRRWTRRTLGPLMYCASFNTKWITCVLRDKRLFLLLPPGRFILLHLLLYDLCLLIRQSLLDRLPLFLPLFINLGFPLTDLLPIMRIEFTEKSECATIGEFGAKSIEIAFLSAVSE